jgi:hypothetical protein
VASLPPIPDCPYEGTPGAPYLARFSRDVGYHCAKSLTFQPKPRSKETGRVPHDCFYEINHGCRGLSITEANCC